MEIVVEPFSNRQKQPSTVNLEKDNLKKLTVVEQLQILAVQSNHFKSNISNKLEQKTKFCCRLKLIWAYNFIPPFQCFYSVNTFKNWVCIHSNFVEKRVLYYMSSGRVIWKLDCSGPVYVQSLPVWCADLCAIGQG